MKRSWRVEGTVEYFLSEIINITEDHRAVVKSITYVFGESNFSMYLHMILHPQI